jgi:hypothetical protein
MRVFVFLSFPLVGLK